MRIQKWQILQIIILHLQNLNFEELIQFSTIGHFFASSKLIPLLDWKASLVGPKWIRTIYCDTLLAIYQPIKPIRIEAVSKIELKSNNRIFFMSFQFWHVKN